MTRKSRKKRTEEQRVRSEKNRDDNRKDRRPGRDDIARVWLWRSIRGIQTRRKNPRADLDSMRNQIVDDLAHQLFSAREAEEVFEELAGRYANGIFPFRTKVHLRR